MNHQTFQANCVVDDKPVIDFVMLYNSSTQTDSHLILNQVDLNYRDFISLFYNSSSGGFKFNSNSHKLSFLQIKNLMYNSNNDDKHWNIKDQLLKTYSKKNNLPESSISPLVNINLQRELFNLDSISNHNKSQVALSLDEILHSLENTTNVVNTHNCEDNLEVLLKMNYSYYSHDLDTTISFSLPFNVNIPMFKKVSSTHNKCVSFEYSKYPNDTKFQVEKQVEEPEINFNLVQEFYEDDETIQTIGTKHLMNTLYDQHDNELMEEETRFKARNHW